MEEIIEKIFKKYKIILNNSQIEKFKIYFNYLIEENEKFNLTAITDPTEVAYKHFLDSVLPVNFIPNGTTILDVGSGAGFPAIPIKILRPDLNIVMVDSLAKRVNFLNEAIKMLNFENCNAVHARAEDFAKENREKFDVVVARAVAPLNTLCEYLLPFVKIGGQAIIFKSQKLDDELLDSKKAIQVLGGKVEKIKNFEIFCENDEVLQRKILFLKKIKPTPQKYPRSSNKPKTSPIK